MPGIPAGPIHKGVNRTMNMYADEKSDKAIVPKKLPNEEGDSSEEAVEGRALPKGNISQTTVVRTQSRAATSSGLAGVRKAARQAWDVPYTISTSSPLSPL